MMSADFTPTIPDSLRLPGAGDPTRVVVLRGIPGSGKSTAARAAVSAAAPGLAVRINNDDLSTMLFGASHTGPSPVTGQLLADARLSLLRAACGQPAVRLVIIDNTNLATKTVRGLEAAALAAGADFLVDDTFLAVPVDVCLDRDANRANPVGPDVIAKMARQAASLEPWTPQGDPLAAVQPHPPRPDLPSTVIVDIDGTLALMGDRGPFDWHRVGEDAPNLPVVTLVRDLIADGQHITIMSGRDGSCREATRAWLDEHVATGLPLFMRAAGDMRKDSIVKHELFLAHVADEHDVRLVLDDRDQVVRLWRALGFACFQVAEGNF